MATNDSGLHGERFVKLVVQVDDPPTTVAAGDAAPKAAGAR